MDRWIDGYIDIWIHFINICLQFAKFLATRPNLSHASLHGHRHTKLTLCLGKDWMTETSLVSISFFILLKFKLVKTSLNIECILY